MSAIRLTILLIILGSSTAFCQNKAGVSSQNDLLRFYPNPASSFINFEYQRPFERGYSLQIFNFLGKKVMDVQNTPAKINLALDPFYRGIYIFQLRDASGKILQSGKFQVVK